MIRRHLVLLLALYSLALCCNGAAAFSNAKSFRVVAAGAGHKSRIVVLHAAHHQSSADDTEESPPSSENAPRKIPPRNNNYLSRRRWISTTSISAIAAAAVLSQPQTALAAPPLTSEVADNFSARVERSLRPKPAKVLRPRMNLDFAVLLMRSSYNAVDEIDIVSMDQFQRDFFLIRQAEYKPYADSLGLGVMQQGDLADPNYFDFISFAQYATISREIGNPQSVFEEQQPVEVGEGELQKFNTVVVKRDPSLAISDLPRRHTEIVGNAILDKLIEKFGETASAIPKIEPGSRPNADTVLAAIKQMVNLFIVQGFAWEGSASLLNDNDGRQQQQQSTNKDDAASAQFSITFTSPATLWSGQSLKAKNNSGLMNDFALKTVRVMMSRAGYNVANASVKYANNQEITTFTVM